MGKKGGSSVPETPDPERVIRASGIENIRGAMATTALNRYNMNTPYGSVSWSRAPAFQPGAGGGGGGSTTGGGGAAVNPATGLPSSGATFLGQFNDAEGLYDSPLLERVASARTDDVNDTVTLDGVQYRIGGGGSGRPGQMHGVWQLGADASSGGAAPGGTYVDPRVGGQPGARLDAGARPIERVPLPGRSSDPLWAGSMPLPDQRRSSSQGGFQNDLGGVDNLPGVYPSSGTSAIGGVGVDVGNQGVVMSPLDEWTQTITLDPAEQEILDLSRDQKIAGGQGVINDLYGMNSGRFFQGGAGSFTDPSTMPGAFAYSGPGAPSLNINRGDIQTALNFDEGGTRSRVEDALYSKLTSRLDPRFGDARSRLETDLVNRGISRGNELWNTELDRFGRESNDAYENAALSAILQGGSEVDRMFGRELSSGTFANSAQQQDYMQQMGLYDAGLRGYAQDFARELGTYDANLRGAAQTYAQGLGTRQQQNQELVQRYQMLSQALAGQPLNGAPPAVTPPGVSVSAADPASIYAADNAARMSAYQASQQANAGKFGGLANAAGTLGAAAISRYCWVARAAYGVEDPRWLVFRRWVLTEAPTWFRDAYGKFGPAIGAALGRAPRWIRAVVRRMMDRVVAPRLEA